LDKIILIIAIIPSILIALILHEIAHGKMAYLRGDPTAFYENRLSLNPLVHLEPTGTLLLIITIMFSIIYKLNPMICLGWAKPVPVREEYLDNSRTDTILVALAGPAVNIIMAFVAGLPFQLGILSIPAGSFTSVDIVSMFLYIFVNINILLAVFNLIPIPPLDGSKILCQFLPEDYQKHIKYPTKAVMIFSMFITLAIINWSGFTTIIKICLQLFTNFGAFIS